jgi:hypothetical protein
MFKSLTAERGELGGKIKKLLRETLIIFGLAYIKKRSILI